MKFINKRPLIICTCGKARSGKSIVSDYIAVELKKEQKRVILSPYTKYLKKYISQITGWDMNDNDKPRDLLQKISRELIKDKLGNKDFFINRQIEDVAFYSYFFDVIVIPDVRFPREIEVLKEKFDNVIAIGVIRDNYDSDLTDIQKNDITEISLDGYEKYDYILYNEGNDKLYSDILKILNELRKKVWNE